MCLRKLAPFLILMTLVVILEKNGSVRERINFKTLFNYKHVVDETPIFDSIGSGLKPGSHLCVHYDDVIMGAIASQITSLAIVYSIVYSGADQSKHQSSTSLAFVWGIHRGPVNSPHKWPVTRKMFPFDDVIMCGSGALLPTLLTERQLTAMNSVRLEFHIITVRF